jgi:Xaa-Pro aminopeptidase
MNQDQRIAAICAGMVAEGLDLIIAVHDGTHFIETPNPVMVLGQFKSMGAAAVVLDRDGSATLIVTPEWDAQRARERSRELDVCGANDLVGGICDVLERRGGRNANPGLAGLAALPFVIADRLMSALPGARPADAVVLGPAAVKLDEEIADAREATRIAEHGYGHLLDMVRLGMSEDELAFRVRQWTRMLGAEDNFLLLCARPHNRAVAPSNGRRLQAGDIILAEITPSYRGQLAQICRTIVLGPASDELKRKYDLVVHAMDAGIRAAVPGVPMSAVCRAINEVLEAEGYGEYCYPPHIRRRGHGLGFACNEPGDVALDNQTILQPGMVFMIHPNQYLPETGYLLCGEPVLMTERGAEPLTARKAALAEIRL